MEQQQGIFKAEAAELELLINSVTEIADDNVRQPWPSTLQSSSEVLNSELKRANIEAQQMVVFIISELLFLDYIGVNINVYIRRGISNVQK